MISAINSEQAMELWGGYSHWIQDEGKVSTFTQNSTLYWNFELEDKEISHKYWGKVTKLSLFVPL